MKPVSSVSVFTPKAVLLGTKYVLSVFALRYDSELLKKKKKSLDSSLRGSSFASESLSLISYIVGFFVCLFVFG